MTTASEFDVVIVLGAAVWAEATASPALARRTRHGARLVLAGAAPVLMVTGGIGKHPPAEAEVMRTLAADAGVRRDAIVVEDTAADTVQSGRACARIMRARGWTRALLVTDDFHLARTRMIFRWFGVDAEGSATPGSREALGWRGWMYYRMRDLAAWPWTLLRLIAGGRGTGSIKAVCSNQR